MIHIQNVPHFKRYKEVGNQKKLCSHCSSIHGNFILLVYVVYPVFLLIFIIEKPPQKKPKKQSGIFRHIGVSK